MTHVVIIGGGASPKNKRWGARIDAADRVVKMFDHLKWQGGTDYGHREDAGFLLINKGAAYTGWSGKRHVTEWWGAVAHPDFLTLAPEFQKRAPVRVYRGTHLAELSRSLTKDSARKLTVARGVVALAAALEFERPTLVTLVGFDNLVRGKISPSAHKTEVLNLGRRRLASWDVAADRALAEHLAARAGARLAFAVEDWPHD